MFLFEFLHIATLKVNLSKNQVVKIDFLLGILREHHCIITKNAEKLMLFEKTKKGRFNASNIQKSRKMLQESKNGWV